MNTYALSLSDNSNNENEPTFCMLDDDVNYCYLEGEVPNSIIDDTTITSEDINSINSEEIIVDGIDTPDTNNKIVSRGYNYSNSSDLNINLLRTNIGETVKLTEEERYWIEKLVEAESADEPYDGKLAVANIIVNRLKSDLFPNNINDVITAPRQFQPFENGAIYERVASQDSILAVNEIFDNGVRVLPNDVFYFMSDTISGNWIDNTRDFYKKIGSHLFFY